MASCTKFFKHKKQRKWGTKLSGDSEAQKRISNRLVDLIDILFGVVVGLNFALIFNNNPIVSMPTFSDIFTLPNISLLVAYIAVILSWVGYHQMMEANPFILNYYGYSRFSIDILIVFVYSILIYSIKNFTLFLTIFPIVFLLYAMGGIIRNKEYSCKVSWSKGSVLFAIAGFVILAIWVLIAPLTSEYSFLDANPLAWPLVFVTLAYNLCYRRERAKKGFNTKKST